MRSLFEGKASGAGASSKPKADSANGVRRRRVEAQSRFRQRCAKRPCMTAIGRRHEIATPFESAQQFIRMQQFESLANRHPAGTEDAGDRTFEQHESRRDLAERDGVLQLVIDQTVTK